MNSKQETELTQLHETISAEKEEHERFITDLRKKQSSVVGKLEEQMALLE